MRASRLRAVVSVAVLALASGALTTQAATGVPRPPAVAEAAPIDFTDVDLTNPFAADIAWLAEQGITTGYSDGTFRPRGSVNRDAMAAFLFRLRVGPDAPAACTTGPFTDVTAAHPFCPHVSWLVGEGITTGYADHSYRPTLAVSREAMAAFLYRVAHDGAKAPACEVAPFTDVPATAPFCGEIAWLAEQAVTTGWADGTFRPGASIERQAMAAFLHRFAALTPPEPPVDPLAPQVSIEAPVAGSMVGGTVTVTASWSVSEDVTGVRLAVDGAPAGSAAAEPFDVGWDSAGVADGVHVLTLTITDAAGRTGTSEPVSVLVHQGPNPIEQLAADRESGAITLDDHARYALYRWFRPQLVPEQYRLPAGMDADDLTVPVIAALADFDELEPATRQELLEFFYPVDPPTLPLAPMTSEDVDSGLATFVEVPPADGAGGASPGATDGGPAGGALQSAVPDPPSGTIALRRGEIVCDPATVRLPVVRTVSDVLDPVDLTCRYETPLADFYFNPITQDPVNGLDTSTDRMDVLLQGPAAVDRPNGVPDALDAIVESYYQAVPVYRSLGFPEVSHVRVGVADFPGGVSVPKFGLVFIDKYLPLSPADDDASSSVYLMRHELFHQYEYGFTTPDNLLLKRVGSDYTGVTDTSTAWWLEANAEWAAHKAQVGAWGTQAASPEFVAAQLDYADALPDHLDDPAVALAEFASPVYHSGAYPQYGAFLFAEYLQRTIGPDAMDDIWRASSVDTPIQVIAAMLAERGTDLEAITTGYHEANFGIGIRYDAPDADADNADDGDDVADDDDDVSLWPGMLSTDRLPGRDQPRVIPTVGVRGGREVLHSGGALYIDLDPADLHQGLEVTIHLEVAGGDLDRSDLRTQVVPLASGQPVQWPERCTPDAEAVVPLDADTAEVRVLMMEGCDRAVVIVSHADPTDVMGLGDEQLELRYSVSTRAVSTIQVWRNGPMAAGSGRAVAATGFGEGYLLEDDYSVSYYDGSSVTPVELYGIVQVVGARDGFYALNAYGDVFALQGTVATVVDDLDDVERIVTDDLGDAVYAIGTDGSLTHMRHGVHTPVAGAAGITDVAAWVVWDRGVERGGAGLAVAADGTVLQLTQATAAPVPGISDAVSVAMERWGDGFVVHADGTLSMITGDLPFTPWPVAGAADIVQVIAGTMDYPMALTSDGRLFYVGYDSTGDGAWALDTGLAGVDRVAQHESRPSWVLADGDVYQTTLDYGTWTVTTTPTGLTDVVEISDRGVVRYALHADGTVSVLDSYRGLVTVPGITGADDLFCTGGDDCFVAFD